MNQERRVFFPCGDLSLEGVLSLPDGEGPFPAVIVCHPHPLYGGNMNNNVVITLIRALTLASFLSFRFNFRGVGRSQGKFSQGIGEQDDVSAAISFIAGTENTALNKIGLAGYSAGAAFSLPAGTRDARISALAAVSPPLSLFNFDYLNSCSKPKLLIIGSVDDFTLSRDFLAFCQKLPEPKEFHVISGADHFWTGYEQQLVARVTAFFTKAFKD